MKQSLWALVVIVEFTGLNILYLAWQWWQQNRQSAPTVDNRP